MRRTLQLEGNENRKRETGETAVMQRHAASGYSHIAILILILTTILTLQN
jgi:hypothetical protein